MSSERTRRLDVQGLARVEGEGSLHVSVRDGTVDSVQLEIFEPPRFFEAILRGRRYDEAPDITSRICGICPVAYQMSACRAMEDVCGARASEEIERLRRLLYCGEWIQSHALHVYLLHAPDFLGCHDAVELAARDRPSIERGLFLKSTGNRVMETVGGRSVHPVNVRLGGFFRAPDVDVVHELAAPLRTALDAALETVEWVSTFDFPEIERDYHFISLVGDGAYPIESGRIGSSHGWECSVEEFAHRLDEEHVPHSTALRARIDGRDGYLTGPLSRFALNRDELPEIAADAASAAGLGATCTNPFRSIVVRAVELVFACAEALRLVEEYEVPDPPHVVVEPVAGTGYGATEAPRGLLLHEYDIGDGGEIVRARIVPPTSQNQIAIEDDLAAFAQAHLDLPDEEFGTRCEQAVRNHDPCISCAAHFLDVTVDRT